MTPKPKQAREWWIGRTQYGFDKWLTAKHPDDEKCRNVFISKEPGDDSCVEYIPVIERSAYEQAIKERDEAWAEIERLKSVGNPTMWAYEQVCKSNDRKRELLTLAEEALESLVNNYVSEWCSVTAAAALAKIRQAKV